MTNERTVEPQYQVCLELDERQGRTKLGLMTSYGWHDDPKRLVFTLARYKFVAKMLARKKHVLEIGCADAFGTRIVAQEVPRVTAVDFDKVFVDDVNARMTDRFRFECRVHDILSGPVAGSFDGTFALDMIEHIPVEQEARFLDNLCASLTPQGVLIIGTPSLESQRFASATSREGHVNCKDHRAMFALLERYFHNVFLFSMNDEVVHTGFYPMAHYYFAIAVGKLR